VKNLFLIQRNLPIGAYTLNFGKLVFVKWVSYSAQAAISQVTLNFDVSTVGGAVPFPYDTAWNFHQFTARNTNNFSEQFIIETVCRFIYITVGTGASNLSIGFDFLNPKYRKLYSKVKLSQEK